MVPVPTPDPWEVSVGHDYHIIVLHDYGSSIGSQNDNLPTIISMVFTEEIHQPGSASIGRGSHRYVGQDHPVPVELNFRAVATITWIQWLGITMDVVNNLPRNVANEQMECLFYVSKDSPSGRQSLGIGSLSLYVGPSVGSLLGTTS